MSELTLNLIAFTGTVLTLAALCGWWHVCRIDEDQHESFESDADEAAEPEYEMAVAA